MKHLLSLSILYFSLTVLHSQCNHIHIKGTENIDIAFDKSGRVISLTGSEDDHEMHFSVNDKGLTMPINTGNEIKITENADDKGGYIIGMGAQGEDGSLSNMKINAKGQIVYWDIDQSTEEGEANGLKQTQYTYDSKGNLSQMTWAGEFPDTKVSDKGELTATFDLSKPDVLFKMGVVRMFPEMNWTTFPMTNANLLTGYSYTQKLHVPERKQFIGYDPQTHQEMYKTIPEKNTSQTITKKFNYQYDSKGQVIEITVTGDGKPQTFKFGYMQGKCEE